MLFGRLLIFFPFTGSFSVTVSLALTQEDDIPILNPTYKALIGCLSNWVPFICLFYLNLSENLDLCETLMYINTLILYAITFHTFSLAVSYLLLWYWILLIIWFLWCWWSLSASCRISFLFQFDFLFVSISAKWLLFHSYLLYIDTIWILWISLVNCYWRH